MVHSRDFVCFIRWLLCSGIISTAGACAGTFADAPHGRAAGEWSVRLPDTHSLIGNLAYGRGGSAEPAVPSAEAPLPTHTPIRPRHVRPARRVVATSAPHEEHAPLASPPLMAAIEPASFSIPQAPVPAVTSETNARYAAREQSSTQQQQFRGGQVLILGLGAIVVVVLVVVLLLVLI
jgi:cobalamin biosynthesis Mg chelatase CobN